MVIILRSSYIPIIPLLQSGGVLPKSMYEKGSCLRRHSESQGQGNGQIEWGPATAHGLELRVRGWVWDKSNRAARAEQGPQAMQGNLKGVHSGSNDNVLCHGSAKASS